jgi:hypothetical protein
MALTLDDNGKLAFSSTPQTASMYNLSNPFGCTQGLLQLGCGKPEEQLLSVQRRSVVYQCRWPMFQDV